jgi:hypothetical protein
VTVCLFCPARSFVSPVIGEARCDNPQPVINKPVSKADQLIDFRKVNLFSAEPKKVDSSWTLTAVTLPARISLTTILGKCLGRFFAFWAEFNGHYYRQIRVPVVRKADWEARRSNSREIRHLSGKGRSLFIDFAPK